MSDRRVSSAVFGPIRVLAVIAAALLLAGVAFEVGHATRNKDNEASSSSPSTVKPGVLGSTITAPDDSTTTTAAPAETTTTAAATTATTAAPAATPTTAAPATTTTTRPPARSCGSGEASARASNTVTPQNGGTWKSTGEADVTNGTDRTIVVDKLTLRLNFTDGTSESFTPDGAIGAQIQPSQIRGFPFSRTTARQGSTVDIIEFQVHPAGTGAECASQPA
jgi:hypothetical protein